MENVRKHEDIKLVTTDKRRNQLVPEPNYHTAKWFSKCLLANKNEENKNKNEKASISSLSILEISKT